MILPYAYGTIIHTIRVWLYHMRIRVWYVPYAYGIEHHNHHYKGSLISFYRFPTDVERRHRWISFFSQINSNGTPWKPGEEDRLCSEHFVSKKKSNLPNNPDYVPSVYPETIAKKSGCVPNVSSLARFVRAQRRSATNEMERLTNEKDEERRFLFAQRSLKAFKNDHGSYCKASTE